MDELTRKIDKLIDEVLDVLAKHVVKVDSLTSGFGYNIQLSSLFRNEARDVVRNILGVQPYNLNISVIKAIKENINGTEKIKG